MASLNHYYKTPHYHLQFGTHSFECISWLQPSLSGKAMKLFFFQFSSVQSLSRVRLFVTPWITARQASLSITNSQSSPKLMCIELVMPSSHLILCRLLLLLPQSLPESGSFLMSQLFTWGGQSTGVSALASCLPKKSQGWSYLVLKRILLTSPLRSENYIHKGYGCNAQQRGKKQRKE